MSKSKVIHRRNLPARLPVTMTIVLWLLFDRIDANVVVQSVCWLILALYWIVAISKMTGGETSVDVFAPEEDPRPTLADKLKERNQQN